MRGKLVEKNGELVGDNDVIGVSNCPHCNCVLPRFLLGLLNGMVAASKTLVSDVCGKEHETVGMGVVTSELR